MSVVKLANYTTSVPVTRTVAEVEVMLANAGAVGIQKKLAGAKIESLVFVIQQDEVYLRFRLPVNAGACTEILMAGYKRPRANTHKRIKEQAERIVWRILRDWIRAQLSIIELGQAELTEVFMPYLLAKGEQTMYELLKERGFKMLPAPEPVK